MAELELPCGRLVLLDDADFDLVRARHRSWSASHGWYSEAGANTHYAIRDLRVDGRRVRQRMHRLILGLGPWLQGDPEVDHRNRNGLDNRRSNLRLVSHAEQAQNRCTSRCPS